MTRLRMLRARRRWAKGWDVRRRESWKHLNSKGAGVQEGGAMDARTTTPGVLKYSDLSFLASYRLMERICHTWSLEPVASPGRSAGRAGLARSALQQARRRVSSRSLIWITPAIARHLKRSDGSVPERHFYRRHV